jgi:hypothetical protein
VDHDYRRALETLLARTSEPGAQARTEITADDVARWPHDAVQNLVAAGILRASNPATTIVCCGCEERCLRQIVILPAQAEEPRRAAWTCDLFSDKGPFIRTADALQRWSMSRSALAKFLGRSLGLEIRRSDREAKRVVYDPIRIGGERRALSVEFADGSIICVGSSRAPLLEVLEWTEAGITVDREALALCVRSSDDYQSGNKRYQPSTAARDDNKLSTELRNRSLQREIERLARKHNNLSKGQLAVKLSSSPQGKGVKARTIERVTRMSKKLGRKNFA